MLMGRRIAQASRRGTHKGRCSRCEPLSRPRTAPFHATRVTERNFNRHKLKQAFCFNQNSGLSECFEECQVPRESIERENADVRQRERLGQRERQLFLDNQIVAVFHHVEKTVRQLRRAHHEQRVKLLA